MMQVFEVDIRAWGSIFFLAAVLFLSLMKYIPAKYLVKAIGITLEEVTNGEFGVKDLRDLSEYVISQTHTDT